MLTQYLSDETFEWLLDELNYEGISKPKRIDLMRRAVGQMEAELSTKFVVPLVSRATNVYTDSPQFAQSQVESALKAKLRQIIAIDQSRNAATGGDSTQKLQNVHETDYNNLIKALLNWEIDYGFKLQPQAERGKEPVQQLGLGRSEDHHRERGGRGGRGFPY